MNKARLTCASRACPVTLPMNRSRQPRHPRVRHSTDFTMSSMTFFASPNTIIVLSM